MPDCFQACLLQVCRVEKRGDATEALEEAKEVLSGQIHGHCIPAVLSREAAGSICLLQTGGEADVEKYSKRTVRVTSQHNEDCRRLLRLMGVPVIEVWSLQLLEGKKLVKKGAFIVCPMIAGTIGGRSTVRADVQRGSGEPFSASLLCWLTLHSLLLACPIRMLGCCVQVYGIASEDMDSLTFATPKLIRNMMKPQSQNMPINEYDYDKVPFLLSTRLCSLRLIGCARQEPLCSAGDCRPRANPGPVCGPVHPVRLRLLWHHQGCSMC